MVAVSAAVSIAATASAAEKQDALKVFVAQASEVDAGLDRIHQRDQPPTVGETAGSQQKRSASQARRVAACAAALELLSAEAEKSYRAALTPPIAAVKPLSLPVESPSARRALNELELALVEAPEEDPLDRAARRFAAAAEALLLRSREPARRAGERESAQTASLQALLATHELFQHAAAQLRLELQEAMRTEGLLQAMRAHNPRDAD